MKRVLIIAYYFPPSVDAGSKRAEGFFEHLAAWGYEPTLITVKDGNYAEAGEEPSGDPPRVIRVPVARGPWSRSLSSRAHQGERGPEPLARQVARRVYREVAYIPDAFKGFYAPAVAAARDLLRREPFDVVFTTSSPFTSLRIGHSLARQVGLPWVADLRDLWTRYHGGYFYSSLRLKVDSFLEARWLSVASALVTVTHGLKSTLEEQFPELSVHCIYNGFLSAPPSAPQRSPDGPFVISFTGTLYEEFDHTIRPLCEALARLRSGRAEAFARIRVEFRGAVNRQFTAIRHEFGLETTIEYRGRTGRAETARVQQASDLLLVMLPPDQTSVVPTKTFEYLATGRPILFIGAPHGEAAEIITRTGTGRAFAPDDAEGIAAYVLDLLENGDRSASVAMAKDAISQYHYSNLARQLAEVFDSVSPAKAAQS